MFYIGSYRAACKILKDDVTFVTKDSFPGLCDLFGEDVMSLSDGADHQLASSDIGPAFSPALFQYYLKNVVKRTKET